MLLSETLTLFSTMVVLAALPSTSVALVVTRSALLGMWHGVAVACGIVLADLFFVALVLFGLSAVAQTMGTLFLLIKYAAAVYIVWFGISLLIKNDTSAHPLHATMQKSSLLTSFLAGFAVTLGDIKAIFFYGSIFATLINLSALEELDVITIVCITLLSVGGVKIIYAFFATKIVGLSQSCKALHAMKKTAGFVMIGVGGFIVVKA